MAEAKSTDKASRLPGLDDFLVELAQANRSPHTLRAYTSDLKAHDDDLSIPALRAYFAGLEDLSAGTRARKQASLSAYCRWAVRNGLIPVNPLERLERVRQQPPPPRAIPRAQFNKILAAVDTPRDRLLLRLLFETGLRISEALSLRIEDLDMRKDDEHLTVIGKGGKQRTLLLDDPALLRELRAYIRKEGLERGLLLRAQKNGTGEPLRYQSVQEKWASYCARAGVEATLHQLRHAHATELVNDGVSLATIRKRLGHRHIQTTLRYAEKSDQAAEAELRARRRK